MNECFKRLIFRNCFIRTITNHKYVVAECCSGSSRSNCTNPRFDQKVLSTWEEEFKLGRKIAQNKLVEMLNIKPIKALGIVTTHKKFCETSPSLMSKNYELCKRNKLSHTVVLRYPYVLIEPELLEKIEKLQMLSINLSRIIPLVKFSTKKLSFLSLRNNETITRINDLCRLFNITQSKSCEILAAKPFFLSLDVKNMEEFLKIFMDNGLSREDILKDLWIFSYSNLFIKSRLECIKEHKVENIKTWMLHCSEESLFKHMKRESDHRDILGKNSIAEYLSERLKCSETVAKYLIMKQPALQSKNLSKMNEMIDFLYNQGFTPNQICKIPKVLLHSTKTVQSRLKELDALGIKSDNLYILTKSQKQYMQHIENLMKTKGKVKPM